jgi:A/G-specific adenine glycosylase
LTVQPGLVNPLDYGEFKKIMYENYDAAGRDFPWRKNISPWGVLVSEFMLQQTQTERVIPYWERWMKRWPTPKALADVSMEQVLREWSGLGYNRRGRFLKNCADSIVKNYGGKVPETPEILILLPGIGPYSSGAIACFAWNYPAVFIETNIRAVMLHFFFNGRNDVKDRDIFPVLKSALDRENPRKWYWALMDYGAALKKITVNPNRRSAHYTRQSRFEGSFRQMRGMVVKTLLSEGPGSADTLKRRTGILKADLYKVLEFLEKDLMVAEENGVYKIRD